MNQPQSNGLYKLFLLAPGLVSLPIQIVEEFCASQLGVKVESPLAMQDEKCAFIYLIIDKDQLSGFRAKLKQLADNLQVDLVLLEKCEANVKRKLAVFDMDSTLIKVEVIDELAIKAGVGDQVIAITKAAMRGELDFSQSFTQRLALLKGLSENVLSEIADTLPLMEGMAELIVALKQRGYKVAILSGGFSYFANHLQQQHGFDYVYSNALQIEAGQVTGVVEGEIVNADRKVTLLKQIAGELDIDLKDTIAVGDGANDLPMLATAGLGIAFHGKPIVREQALHAISTLGLDGLLYLIEHQD